MAISAKTKEELRDFIRQEVKAAIQEELEQDRLEMAKLVEEVENFIGEHRIRYTDKYNDD